MKKFFKKNLKYITIPLILFVFYVISSNFVLPNISQNFNKDNLINRIPKSFLKAEAVNGTATIRDKKDIELYPGGGCLGIKVSTSGVLVVGFSDIDTTNGKVSSTSREAGIQVGDIILKINDTNLENTKHLIEILSKTKDDSIKLLLDRDGEKIKVKVNVVKDENKAKIGLWVRDSTAGIGTLTFYEEKSNKFGALGHPITDVDTNSIIKIKDGRVIDSAVLSVRKGQRGTPGELKSIFVNEEKYFGEINKNTISGIFGSGKREMLKKCQLKPLKVGYKEEIKEGKAQIISTVDENGPKYYDIEIVKLLSQDKPSPKSMIIKVTDEELLKKTGGIVQGMSGSPIIQDGKIVGAVTHVLVNKPDVGYGIYIEWMLEEVGILKK